MPTSSFIDDSTHNVRKVNKFFPYIGNWAPQIFDWELLVRHAIDVLQFSNSYCIGVRGNYETTRVLVDKLSRDS